MSARLRLPHHAVAALIVLLSAATGAPAADRKPNFVFVYSDDHRWDAMGVVQKEHDKQARFPWFKSPNLDRLAVGGVRFRNAFVTLSLCAPSRAAFLTGRYNHANGITNNSKPFPADAATHATLLRAAGYKTAYVGKWHMGNQKGPRPGFDYSASFIGQGQYNDCPFEIDGKSTPTKGWVDAVSTDFAIRWMKDSRDKPFSLVLGLKSPHGPRGGNVLPEHLRKLYANETSRPTPNCGVPAVFHQKDPKTDQFPLGLTDNAVHLDYLRHIAGVDEQVGRVLDALDELKLTDDTVVVYASDNGYFLGEHNSGDKRALYDESLRIPFLVRYPRLFGKGKTVDEAVLNIDLAPTFLDLAGVPIPKEVQGASWKELAAGRKPAKWRNSFFAEYYKELGNVPTCYAIRTTTHKLVKYPGRPEWTEVFDLTADPYEVKNLAADAKLTAKLEGELAALVKDVGYTEPKPADPPKKDAPPVPKKDEFAAPKDVVYKEASGDKLQLHIDAPADAKPGDNRTAIVFFFGGGWSSWNPTQFEPFARHFAGLGCVAICADYRVSSRHKTTPADAVRDAKSAVRYVREHAKEWGADPNRIVAAGGSAGGHLAACAALVPGLLDEKGAKDSDAAPNALVLFNPVLDTSAAGFGGAKRGDELKPISPQHHVREKLPPVLVLHGTADTTVPFKQVEAFAKAMKDAGNVCEVEAFEGRGHGFFNHPDFRKGAKPDDYEACVKRAAKFLEDHKFLPARVPQK